MPLCGLELKIKWADREFCFSTRKFTLTVKTPKPQNLKLIIWYTAPVWFFHEMRNNDLSITHPIGSHYSQIVFRPTGLKSKSDKSKVYPSCVSWWHEPHSEKKSHGGWLSRWRFWAVFFAQNTTLIIISHVIKIITKGFMHNNRLLTCQNGLGQMPQSHFAPLVKCRHYGFSSDDIGRFSDDMV